LEYDTSEHRRVNYPVAVNAVVAAVLAVTDVSIEEYKCKRRHPTFVRTRRAAAFLLRACTPLSLEEIAVVQGKRRTSSSAVSAQVDAVRAMKGVERQEMASLLTQALCLARSIAAEKR